MTLSGRKVLLFAASHYEELELWYPKIRLEELQSGGRKYKHFQSSKAVVERALGEFNWRVKRGEKTLGDDYVAPPYLFSTEQSEGEVNWTTGQWIPAKLVVVGAVSNGFSIADPNDPGMLDVVGFDTSAPALIADFARGDV